MPPKLHDNEFAIDAGLVQRLVSEQFPEWSELPLRPLNASGSSNLLYRLGNEYLIRLPRQPGGGQTIKKEHHWQTALSEHLSIMVPRIVALGAPTDRFNESWSIQQWLPGDRIVAGSVNDAVVVEQLAAVIHELRAMPLPDVVSHELRPYRGRSLKHYDKPFRKNFDECLSIDGLDLDLKKVLRIWEEGLQQPEAISETWFHSDLVAENLLTDGAGQLSAVLDFGGLGIGDPAIDLHGAWEILTPDARQRFRNLMNVSDAEWQRARAWALAVPLMTFTYYWNTMPGRISDRMVMIQSVLEED